MLLSFANDTVTVTEPGARDDRGTPVPDYDSPESVHELRGCLVQPGASDLDMAGRSSVGIRWTVYAPAGAEVSPFAAVTWQGVRYALEEPPAVLSSPTGALSHMTLRLVDFEG
ncbi:MAG: hypothetical protein QJR09_05270 [Micrococcus sp.]|nr:hypothetical protein [Micrococcus sp.]